MASRPHLHNALVLKEAALSGTPVAVVEGQHAALSCASVKPVNAAINATETRQLWLIHTIKTSDGAPSQSAETVVRVQNRVTDERPNVCDQQNLNNV